ncbi:MAG: FAD-binding oxidoreductase [Planctomycetes bacterium]|nr:FAD-binding oxidoreductase [Planctomycetota bacterium]
MSLRSADSIWQKSAEQALVAPVLQGEHSCEVAVLGGGVTGALIADRLVQAGVNTALVDMRELGTGSTAASTGLLQYEIDTPLCELVKKVGENHAVAAYRRGLTAIDEIEAITQALGDSCSFSRRDSLYFASHWWHFRRLNQEYECRRHFGFDVSLLSRTQLAEQSTLRSAAAIRSRGDGQIDPFRFTKALLRRAQQGGLKAFARSEVSEIDEQPTRVTLRTAEGSIAARHIVYATGYGSHRYLKEDEGSLHCTYAVASEPLTTTAGWPEGSLVWETARPYFYARQTADGRAIIGGEDTLFSSDHKRESLIERKAAALVQRFEKLFPQILFRTACAWAGTFGESKDGLAYIGQVPGRPSAYFAIGYGGNGITFSAIAARLITDLYLKRPNDDAALFRFGR